VTVDMDYDDDETDSELSVLILNGRWPLKFVNLRETPTCDLRSKSDRFSLNPFQYFFIDHDHSDYNLNSFLLLRATSSLRQH
jgi:hypothetical protein